MKKTSGADRSDVVAQADITIRTLLGIFSRARDQEDVRSSIPSRPGSEDRAKLTKIIDSLEGDVMSDDDSLIMAL